MTTEEEIHSILDQYRNDEVMLDALFQWATNPTSMSAGYGLEENYPYIKKNLALRHSLTPGEAEKRLKTLREVCSVLLTEAEQLPDDKYRIGHVQKRLSDVLCQGDYGNLRLQGVLRRLREASEETRKALLLFNLLEDDGASVSAVNFTNPPAQYSNHQSEFQAYYKSIFGEISPVLRVAREIVAVGAYNELYWVPSPTAKSSAQPILVKAMLPSIAELEGLGSRLPPTPDVPEILEAYWGKDTEVLRLVDIISHTLHCVAEIDESLPVNTPKFIGLHGKTVAFSPAIRNDAKQYIELAKDEKLFPVRQTLEKALLAVEKLVEPEAGLGVLWTGQGEVVWKFTTTPPLYVFLAPWLTTSTQTSAPFRVNFQEKPHVLFIIPFQSRASFLAVLEKHSGYSLKETRWEKSLGILTNLERTKDFQQLVGQRHPLLEKILEAISESSVASPQLAPVAADEVIKPKAPPERPTLPDTQGPLSSAGKGLGILLGTRGLEKIFWYPGAERSWNFAIVGSAGTGKTQTVKAVLREFSKQQIPYIVFDFRNDYVPPKSSSCDFGSVLDLSSISINPLELDGSNSPRDQKYQVSDIIDLVYAIGERQIGYVREAIKLSYENKGIHEDREETWKQTPPTFADIQQNLERLAEEGARTEKESIKGIFARLDPIFDYGIFSSKTVMPFEELAGNCIVVNLGILPNDNLKAVVCEFLLRKLRYYLYSLPESREPRLFIIVDEAHRLKYEKSSSTGQLLKEARKYGVGLILSTQDPVDFPDLVYNNIGGILSLQLTDPKYAKSVAEHLGGQVSWQSVKNELSEKFAAFVKFSSHPNAIRLRVTPYYERSNE